MQKQAVTHTLLAMPEQSAQSNPTYAELRSYLQSTHSDDDLFIFCHDHFVDVYQDLTAGMSKTRMILLLLDYCTNHEQWADLVGALHNERPQQFEQRFPDVRSKLALEIETPVSQETPYTIKRNPKQVFVSHARQDAEFANKLAADLRQSGWSVWIAPDSIKPGEQWVDAINRGLDESGVMIIVLTPAALASGWVKSETSVAVELVHKGEMQLIQIMLEECEPAPLSRTYHWIPFQKSYPDGFKALLSTLKGNPRQNILNARTRPITGIKDKRTTENKKPNPDADALIDALVEIVQRDQADKEWRQKLRRKWTDKSERIALLVKLLETPLALKPQERLKIGDELSELGDPRKGVGLRADGLPDIDWVAIPDDGPFIYGDNTEKRIHSPAPFRISRYPITYAQFQVFLDAPDGFQNPGWWKDLSALESHRNAPGDQRFKYANHPRETVSWYDAAAFCYWLSIQLGYAVMLPTEQRWEKAARGTDGRAYPWGPDYIAGNANIDETSNKVGPNYLQSTSAVGMYPQGKSPYGAMDMSGNVWEWCLNEYENPKNIQLKGNETRVLRGGSWDYNLSGARAAYRFRNYPLFRLNFIGFRLVSAPVP